MDTIPIRPRITLIYRSFLVYAEKHIILPNINPAYYQVVAILLSILCFYAQTPILQVLMIGIILATDWLDGATARSHGTTQKSGYIADVVIDRASEGFIFFAGIGTVIGQSFFVLWLINILLTLISARSSKHLSLPLRFGYMLVIFLQAL